MNTLFWIVVIIGAALFAAVVIRDWLNWDGPPTHTLDCREWSMRGVRDPLCVADHPTNYFASPRAQVEFENSFDNQIGVHRG